MLTYSRWSPLASVPEVEAHVRAHLSSVATPDDDPMRLADDVQIERREEGAGVLIVGRLDAEADAPYLRDDWSPEQDIQDNPLSVPSIEDQP